MQYTNITELPNGILSLDREGKGRYEIHFHRTDILIIRFGRTFSKTAASFNHLRLIARRGEIFEFKHYHPIRGKFWTAKPGVEFYFAFAGKDIEIAHKETYSHPMIRIGGEELSLSTSGGTVGDGWVDWILPCANTFVDIPWKTIKALAKKALTIEKVAAILNEPPEEYRFSWTNRDEDPEHTRMKNIRWRNHAAKILCGRLKKGQKLVLKEGCKFHGQDQREFEVVGYFTAKRGWGRARAGYHVKLYPSGGRVEKKNVDWVKTAEANCIQVPKCEDLEIINFPTANVIEMENMTA